MLVGRQPRVGDQDLDTLDRHRLAQRCPPDFAVVDGNDHALRGLHERTIRRGHVQVGCRQAISDSESIAPEKQGIGVQTPKVLSGQRADQSVGRAAQNATGHDDLDVRSAGELGRNVDGARYHGQVSTPVQLARHLHSGGTGTENDRIAVVHEPGGGAPDAPLLVHELTRFLEEGRLVGAVRHKHRAAMNAAHQAFVFFQQFEIATDRDLGGRQADRQVGDEHVTGLSQNSKDLFASTTPTASCCSIRSRPNISGDHFRQNSSRLCGDCQELPNR